MGTAKASELHVMYGLALKPELAKSEFVNPAWFSYRPFAQLVQYINQQDTVPGYAILRDGFDEEHPDVMKPQDWDNVMNSDETTASFGPWLNVLKREYTRKRAKAAALTYAKDPSSGNFQSLTGAIELMQGVAHNDDPGMSLADYAAYVRHVVTTGQVEHGVKTYPQLDNMLNGGLMPSTLVTIGARPGVGKSALAVNLAQLAVQNNKGVSVDIFSLEMSAVSVNRRLLAAFSGLPMGKLVNPAVSLQPKEMAYMQTIADQMAGYNLKVYDEFMTLPQIVKTIRQRVAAAKHGYMAVVDYLQLVKTVGAGNGSEQRYREVGMITGELKRLTNELEIPIVLLSQLNRRVETQDVKRPSLSDLRESGDIEQDSNTVGLLWSLTPLGGSGTESVVVPAVRDEVLTIAKNRDGELGEIRFKFDAPKMRFRTAF